MFGRMRRKKALINNMDDTRTTVYDFRRRLTEFESYRPPEYVINPALDEDIMYPRLDAYLAKLFAGGVDPGNGDVLDELIFSAAIEGMPDLARQRYEHKDVIVRLAARYVTDYEDLKKIRNHRQLELEETMEDHKKTCSMEKRISGREQNYGE